MKKRFFIFILCLTMLMQSLPVNVLAAENGSGAEVSENELNLSEGSEENSEAVSAESENDQTAEETDSTELTTETMAEEETEEVPESETAEILETEKEENPQTEILESELSEETEEETESMESTEVPAEVLSNATANEEIVLEWAEVNGTGMIQEGSFEVLPSQPVSYGGIMLMSESSEPAKLQEALDYVKSQLILREPVINIYKYRITTDYAEDMVSGLVNENPELYYVSGSYSYSYTEGGYIYELKVSYETGFDDSLFEPAVEKALACVTEDMTDLEKAIALHDYLVVTCEYDYDNYLSQTIPRASYTSYGPLVNKKAVCQGYALAYKYLLQQCGITCYMVTSDSMNHAWNLIELDGEYYQVDTTWDDPAWDLLGRVRHNYMFLSDAAFGKNSSDRNAHSDWVVEKGVRDAGLTATATDFDNAFWVGVNTNLILIEDDYYYITNDSTLQKYDQSEKTASSVASLGERWFVWGSSSSYYTGAYTGLSYDNGRLFFNGTKNIYSILPDGSEKTVEFAADTTNGYIYGSALRENGMEYCIHQTPNLSESETVSEAEFLSLNRYSMDVKEGESCDLSLLASPSDKADTVVWTSSNEEVATVSQSGKVTTLKEGNTTITVTSGSLSAECELTVIPPIYSVKFYGKDGKLLKEEEVRKGNSATPPAAPQIQGYTFKEWEGSYEKINTDTEVTAVYELISYSITYHVNGGTNGVQNPESYTIESKTISFEEPTRDGYTFAGWYMEEDFSDFRTYGIAAGSTGDLELYAKWEIITYTITWQPNGGSSTEDYPIVYTVETDTITLEEPQKENYAFEGWYLTEDFSGERVYEIPKGTFGNLTFYAKWKELVTSIIMKPSELTINEGESSQLTLEILPENVDIKELVWESSDPDVVSVSESGELTALTDGSVVITASIHGKSAQCQVKVLPVYYSVRFLGYNDLELKTEEVRWSKSASAPEVPEVTGYIFKGWDNSFDKVYEKKEIRAIYEPITYTIAYKEYILNNNEAHEEEIETDNPSVYTIETATFSLADPLKEKDGFQFVGWYADKEYTGDRIYEIAKGTTGNLTLYAKWKDERGLWIEWQNADGDWINWQEETPEFIYTGKAVKPQVRVHDGAVLLTAGKDYTVSYKNNTKVNLLLEGFTESKAPAVIITGKGNYTGKLAPKYFMISPVDMTDNGAFQADPKTVTYSATKVQKPVPTVYWNGKKLTNKTDFTVSWPDTSEGAYKEPGSYQILISGRGNYTGSFSTEVIIKAKEEVALSSVTFGKIKDIPYSGSKVVLNNDKENPNLVISYKKQLLVQGTDYEIIYDDYNYDYTEIGTHKVLIKGLGTYKGTKWLSFKITGTSINKAVVSGLSSITYNGTEQKQAIEVRLTKNSDPLMEGTDYTVVFAKTDRAGTASVSIIGKGHYTGTIKKSFTVKPYSMAEKAESAEDADWITAEISGGIEGESNLPAFAYEKGGTKPAVDVKFRGITLVEGVDYTLSYANTSNLGGDLKESKQPKVTIKGKKNFTGSRVLYYEVIKEDIGTVNISVPDKVVSSKANQYASTPVLTDENGKKLKAGTDYEKTYQYYDAADRLLGKKDKPGEGDWITVKVTGKGKYTGEICGKYKIIGKNKSLASASVKINQKVYYTGEAITFSQDLLTVKIGKVTLGKDDFEIVSYSNNLKKGTAKVTIQGIGEYGGTKTVSFTINAQKMTWWEKLTVLMESLGIDSIQ